MIFRTNKIGNLEKEKKRKKPKIKLPRKTARTVFEDLKNLPKLTEFEKKQLTIYKPSFTKQTLDFSKLDVPGLGRSSLQKGRILYGNETDVNEYPWQVEDHKPVTKSVNLQYLRSRCGLTGATSVEEP